MRGEELRGEGGGEWREEGGGLEKMFISQEHELNFTVGISRFLTISYVLLNSVKQDFPPNVKISQE